MLGPGRYLLGVAEILLLAGAVGLGARRLSRRLLPSLEGAPAWLSTLVLAAALLILPAELLGSFALFEPAPYLALVLVLGVGLWRLLPAAGGGGAPVPVTPRRGAPPPRQAPSGRSTTVPTLVALLVAALAVLHFAADVKTRLGTGMTGFDTTWYHGPFAAGFFQSGDTWHLHFIAPQFLAWFYPANGEIFHAVGMLAFSRDALSPLLNLGWFLGCLLACWCIGRPCAVAPWSLALGAVALSIPALADQAGEARNDLVGIFFLLAGAALALNVRAEPGGMPRPGGERRLRLGPYAVVGLAAGLAAGTKLNFLLPAAVLVAALPSLAPRPGRIGAFAAAGSAALVGGGYWYLRNLAHAGNPLPWIHHLGPIDLPAPQQALGGREAHSVLGYLTDGSVWADWFLPGLHGGLWIVWPLLLAGAVAGLALAVARHRALAVAGLVGLVAALAWLVAPTSASGPDGMPRGFESGLRYLAPALVLGLALLPTAPPLRRRLLSLEARAPAGWSSFPSPSGSKLDHPGKGGPRRGLSAGALGALLLVVAAGYPIQRHYLQSRYRDPTFTAPGLNAAFAWARDVADARIATTSTRQYPLFGTDLSNRVQYLGIERPHGGFEPPANCPRYRRLLDEGHYDYAIATYDRQEPGNPNYPPSARWTESPRTKVVLRKPPTVVFKLTGPLDPSGCGAAPKLEAGGANR